MAMTALEFDFASHVNGVTVYQSLMTMEMMAPAKASMPGTGKTASLPYGLDGSQSVPTNACAYGKKYNTDYCRANVSYLPWP